MLEKFRKDEKGMIPLLLILGILAIVVVLLGVSKLLEIVPCSAVAPDFSECLIGRQIIRFDTGQVGSYYAHSDLHLIDEKKQIYGGIICYNGPADTQGCTARNRYMEIVIGEGDITIPYSEACNGCGQGIRFMQRSWSGLDLRESEWRKVRPVVTTSPPSTTLLPPTTTLPPPTTPPEHPLITEPPITPPPEKGFIASIIESIENFFKWLGGLIG